MFYNVLNFPAGVVRMTAVTEDDSDSMSFYPDQDMRHKKVKEVKSMPICPFSLYRMHFHGITKCYDVCSIWPVQFSVGRV